MPTLVTLFQVQLLLIDVQMQLLKKNNTEGKPIHFLIICFLKKKKPCPLAHNTDEKNQALKVIFFTAAVNLVVQLDL